ncbi:MAG: hypothetical protein NZM05_12595, partial [Chloroherpetonaceae bacterium]|nr:hypothetical protein [Chloroherpetonaceae bacterium]
MKLFYQKIVKETKKRNMQMNNMKQILNSAGYLCDDALARQVQAVFALKLLKGAFLPLSAFFVLFFSK